MILLDTSGLLAALSEDQAAHPACRGVLASVSEPPIISPFIVAELDYLITRDAGVEAELTFLAHIAGGAYRLADFNAQDVEEAREVISRYRQLNIGLADASIVVLSRKFNELDLLTLDHRHFRTLRGARGKPFRIVP